MDDDKKNLEFLNYGVELFKYHADQRLRCLRYYTAILAAVIVGGIVGIDRILGKHDNSPEMIEAIVIICALASAGITLFFWLIDIRNRVLTEYAEKGLKKIEEIIFKEEGDFKIVSNCENQAEKAWQYGQILPIFFTANLITLAVIPLIIQTLSSFSHLYCLLSSLLILTLILMLIVGWYAEHKFSKMK